MISRIKPMTQSGSDFWGVLASHNKHRHSPSPRWPQKSFLWDLVVVLEVEGQEVGGKQLVLEIRSQLLLPCLTTLVFTWPSTSSSAQMVSKINVALSKKDLKGPDQHLAQRPSCLCLLSSMLHPSSLLLRPRTPYAPGLLVKTISIMPACIH